MFIIETIKTSYATIELSDEEVTKILDMTAEEVLDADPYDIVQLVNEKNPSLLDREHDAWLDSEEFVVDLCTYEE